APPAERLHGVAKSVQRHQQPLVGDVFAGLACEHRVDLRRLAVGHGVAQHGIAVGHRGYCTTRSLRVNDQVRVMCSTSVCARTRGGKALYGIERCTMWRTASSSICEPEDRSISTFSTLPSALMATVTSTVPNSCRAFACSGKFAVPTRSIFWRHSSTYSA